MNVSFRGHLILLSALAATSVVALPVVADAEAPDEARARARVDVERARRAYNLGRFDEALDAYESAYQQVPLPTLLFNIGQCHRKAGRPERAIFFFEGYLREAEMSETQRKSVEELIRESRQEKLQMEAMRAVQVEDELPAKPWPDEEERPPLPRAEPAAPALVADKEAESVGIHERWWFWTAIGVAAAAAGTAIALSVRGGGAGDEPTLGTVDWR